jgi:hypothetical protein
MIVRNSLLAKVLNVNGIVLYPFVFLAPKDPDVYLLNHELIHLAQIKRLGVIRFYYSYLKEYALYRAQKLSHDEAYRAISFEREAYENDRNLDYLA